MQETDIDATSFISLLLRHQGMIFRYVVMYVPQHADAEEVYQHTCLTMWEKWCEGQTPDHFGAWARTIAYNHVRNFLRKHRRQPGLMTEELLERIHAVAERQEDSGEQRQHALDECLDKLPQDHSRLLHDYYQSGGTVAELAAKRGRPKQGLYKLLQRIRKALLDCVNRQLAEGGT